MNNSIRLKELQVVSGALSKGDEGLKILFSFSKGFFFGRGGEDGSNPPLSKGSFFVWD